MGNKRIYLGSESSKYAKIAGGAIITVTSLFFVLMAMGFEITGSDDVCLGTLDDPCISYGNICNLGPDNYDIYNPDEIKMDFSPTVKDYWIFFKDGRVKKQFLYDLGINASTQGWRYENFTNETKSRSDVLYVHRFARYSCQEYMLVGLKDNPDDSIKWGVGIGNEYLDPFWYGVNETPTNLVSSNISVELGIPINFTTNISGATTTCVDIDHPEYGDNYSCGSPNANFTINLSYFRKTEFSDEDTEKTMDSDWTRFNGTTYGLGGSYGTSVPHEWCEEYYITMPDPRKLRMSYYVYSWVQGSNYFSDVPVDPQIVIRDSDREILETIIDTDFDENSSGYSYVVSEDSYESGLYGFCVKIPFAIKPPQTNKTDATAPGTPPFGYTRIRNEDIAWNYDIAWFSSQYTSTNGFCTNSLKHVFVYANGTNVTVEYTGICSESGTKNSTNPHPTENLDFIEVWTAEGSGSAGINDLESTAWFNTVEGCTSSCNGGVFWARKSEEGNTYTVTGNFLYKGPDIDTYVQNDSTFYISSHQYDQVQNLSINLTGIENAKNVQIYINGELSNNLGFIYNTSSGNVSETDSTSFNLLTGNSTTFRIPKGAMVTNTTLNFTGSNSTWEVGEETIPETWSSSYGPPSPALPSGSQGWYGPVSNAVDGYDWTDTGGWIYGETLWDVEWMAYIYENYTKDSDAMTGNWSSAYLCSNSADITFDADCWSGSAWVEIVSNSGSTCYNGMDRSYRVYELPATCLAQSILQVKNSLQYGNVGCGTVQRASYYEGKANYYRTGSPENMTIEVGIVDGAYEYEGTGELTGSDSTTDFVAEVNNYLETCAADEDDFCEVPIYFNSQDGGIVTIDNIEVLYTYDPNPIKISSSVVQSFLNGSTDDVDIPVYFYMDEGSFNVSDLKYDYKGGNDTIEIFSFEQGNTSNNETLNIFAYYSSFFKNLPYTWASKIFFIPKTNSSNNVIPYGQTTTKPAYNITTTNYGGDINLSIKVDESFSCLNITWSNNATKNESNVINTTWQTINSNVEYLNNTQIWLWADFENCNASDQRILQPSIEIEGYCVDCEWF